MNREQRRAEARKLKLHKKAANPIPVKNVPINMGYQIGDLFTVVGVKHLNNGKVIHNCKPGEETLFKVEGFAE